MERVLNCFFALLANLYSNGVCKNNAVQRPFHSLIRFANEEAIYNQGTKVHCCISKEIFVNKSVRIEPLDDKCLVLSPQTSIPNTNKTFVVFKCIADCLD